MCEWGNTKPMVINGRVRDIDSCIFDIVQALNKFNLITMASCCGHKNPGLGNICLKDGRVIAILKNHETAEKIWEIASNKWGDIHGK